MNTSDEILREVNHIFTTQWERRDGRKVPDAEEIELTGNKAVTLEGTVLYADMVDSTGLVDSFKDWFAAEIYKSYLAAASRIIRNNDGEITAFDGDRVMAVYIGDVKNSSAARTALQINYIVREINNALKKAYSNTSYQLFQTIGIDTSPLFVARTGIRNSNDLVWVGRAANYAAKLCEQGDQNYPTFISETVFKALADEVKFGGQPRTLMWEKVMWQQKGVAVYRSNWWWKF